MLVKNNVNVFLFFYINDFTVSDTLLSMIQGELVDYCALLKGNV